MASHQFGRDQSRAKWTAASTKIFADLLVEQIQQGNRSNNVFSKKAWKFIQDEFNRQTSLKFDRQQLKNHLDVLRKRYNHVKVLLEHAGFGWDDANCMVVAEEDVWQKYIEAHPAAEPFKRNGCPIYKQLCIIFSESGIEDKCTLSDSAKAIHEAVQEQSRAKWTTYLEKVFTDLILEQVLLQGNRSNDAFSKKTWNQIREEFSRSTGVKFDQQQLLNHYRVLRSLYSSIKWLLGLNGFIWDKSHCTVVAEKEVWAKCIKDHPEMEAIRGKECPVFENLDKIFSDPSGNREFAFSDQQIVDTEMDMDSVPSEEPSKQDQSRAKWTASLDKTFVDLLIEQTSQNTVSNKRAWKRIREEFNKQTGLKFDEQQLRNHQSVLRRLYNNIRSLLEQNGFSWNDSRLMVLADDEVWNSYIKAHPEADPIRGKECPIFKQLCILFSHSEVEGRYVQSSHDTDRGQDTVEVRQVQPIHNTELDQDIISMGTPEVASLLAEPIADEGSSHSAEEGNKSDGRNKRWNVEPVRSRLVKRIYVGTNCPARVDPAMTPLTDNRVTALPHCPDQFSISNCIKVLNGIQGIDQRLYLAASDLFQEPDKRETFISIKSEFRLAWLKAKCK